LFRLIFGGTPGIDRRITSRKLHKKENFLTNYSDPVYDILRLIDFLHSQSRIKFSKIGIYGFSAGGIEGRFAAALDYRISAVVLACATYSHNQIFKDKAWVPTYSCLIIFPELGLGNPVMANITYEQWLINLNKLKPKHNTQARKIYNDIFPFFEDLDPLKVTSLIAPVPLLIVTGAQDSQFNPGGVIEVDRAVKKAYDKFGFSECSNLYIQPRASHYVTKHCGFIIAAFFERWLK